MFNRNRAASLSLIKWKQQRKHTNHRNRCKVYIYEKKKLLYKIASYAQKKATECTETAKEREKEAIQKNHFRMESQCIVKQILCN